MQTVLSVTEGIVRILGVMSVAMLLWSVIQWIGMSTLGDLAFILFVLTIVVTIVVTTILAVLAAIEFFIKRCQQGGIRTRDNDPETRMTTEATDEVTKGLTLAVAARHDRAHSRTWPWLMKAAKSPFLQAFDRRPWGAAALGVLGLLTFVAVASYAQCRVENKLIGTAVGLGLIFIYWLVLRVSSPDSGFALLEVAGLVVVSNLITGVVVGLALGIIGLLMGVLSKSEAISGYAPSGALMLILGLVLSLGGMKAFAWACAALGFGSPAATPVSSGSVQEGWTPGTDGHTWVRADDLTAAGLFILQAAACAAVVVLPSHFFDFF